MPRTPSIASKASLKKFGRKITSVFKKKDRDSFDQPTPMPNKGEGASQQDHKDKVKAEHETEVAKDKDTQEEKVEAVERTDKVVRNVKPEKLVPSKPQVFKAIKEEEEELEQESEVVGNYAVVFAHQNNENTHEFKYGDRSYYTPNAVGIFEPLYESYQILAANYKFLDKNLDYFSPQVSLYYAVLYYVRILQIRDVHSANTYDEDKFFRAFSRAYKLESLPVAGFLECAFANIGYYPPKDKRLTYMLPQLEPMMTFRQEGQIGTQRYYYQINDSNALIQPDVPMLYDWVRHFCLETTRLEDRYVFNNTYVPMKLAQGTDFRLGGRTINNQPDGHINDTTLMHLSSPGIARRTPEPIERLIQVKQILTSSGFSTKGPGSPTTSQNTSIFAFLCMNDNNWGWFQNCIDAALTHSRGFNGITNLKNIAAMASLETAGKTILQVNGSTAADADNVRITLADGTINWFPNIIRSVRGNVTWYEPGQQDYHFWMARQAPVSATFTTRFSTGPTAGDRHEVTSLPDERSANNIDLDTAVCASRFGPYWGVHPSKATYRHQILGARSGSADNIEYFDRMTNYVRMFYSQDLKTKAW